MFELSTTTFVFSDEDLNDMKIIKSHEERFLCMLLGRLGASLWGNLLTGSSRWRNY